MIVICWLSDVLEQVKLSQLQNISLPRHVSALIPLQSESDDSKSEHIDWSQLWRGGISLPFSVTVGKLSREIVVDDYITAVTRVATHVVNLEG